MGQMWALHSIAARGLLKVTAAEDVLPQLMWFCEILWEGIAELLIMLGFDGWGRLHSCEQCSFYSYCGSIKEYWRWKNKRESAKAAKNLQ